jgi:hypothetical protein
MERQPCIAVIGGGPAGLMAAEVAAAGGAQVALYDHLPSVGRKVLIAGKGGLNLTHSEPFEAFAARYGVRSAAVRPWLDGFGPDALRAWAHGLGAATIIGSSGRVFPADLKAAPLLRGWVRRLREQGVRFHLHRRWLGWDEDGALRFARTDADHAPSSARADATVLAMGGGSWPRLGSDAAWLPLLREAGVAVAELKPANCGFEAAWSDSFRARFAGAPVKPVAVALAPGATALQGEFVVTAHGVEGSLVYALSAPIRDAIARDGPATVYLDLVPGLDAQAVTARLSAPRGKRSLSEFLRRQLHLEGVRLGLLYEGVPRATQLDMQSLARAIKAVPLTLTGTRPLAEAISSAGGVCLESLTDALMLRARPGVFCAGEMLDWEAPTGGYLLTACLASGRHAALGALAWLQDPDGPLSRVASAR